MTQCRQCRGLARTVTVGERRTRTGRGLLFSQESSLPGTQAATPRTLSRSQQRLCEYSQGDGQEELRYFL